MSNNNFVYYFEANMVCLVIFALMLIHDVLGIDRQEKQLKFDRALVAFMAYFLADSFWAAVVAGKLPQTEFFGVLVNLLDYVLMAAVTYTWLNYAMAVVNAPHRNRRINKFAIVFPFIITSIALVITYIVAPQKILGNGFEAQPGFYVFMTIAPLINILAAILYVSKSAKEQASSIEKSRHVLIGILPLLVLVCGLVQVYVLPDIPVFCFGCVILMIICYIQSMETLISKDPLTQLNNRGQLMRYVSQHSNIYPENGRTFVVLIDANKFKAINDGYGHAEGDQALIMIAETLKRVVGSYSMSSFLARYGGDEFMLIAHPSSEDELLDLISDIHKSLAKECEERDKQYRLSVSAGYSELLEAPDTIQKCMQRADKKMYAQKTRE